MTFAPRSPRLAVLVALALLGSCAGPRGVVDGRLAPCPWTPDCATSDEEGAHIAPLAFEGDPAASFAALIDFLQEADGAALGTHEAEYAHLVSRTALLRFVDDRGGRGRSVADAGRIGATVDGARSPRDPVGMHGAPELRVVDGAGNRFLLWDARGGGAPRDPAAALRAHGDATLDGLLVLEPAVGDARARLVVVNRDGTRPEMCGNGLRCAALHLAGRRAAEFVVETDAGPRPCRVDDAGVAWVSLGRATVGAPFEVLLDGARLPAFAVDVGNPHATLDAAGLGVALAEAPLAAVAEAVLATGRFPLGVNVELALNHGDHLEARVHERGVGETRACGTGAAALAAVALEHLEHGAPVRVHMPGGVLVVDRDDAGGELWLSGPAHLGAPFDAAHGPPPADR